MSSAASRPPNIASPSTTLSTGQFSRQNAPSAASTAMVSSNSSNPESKLDSSMSAHTETGAKTNSPTSPANNAQTGTSKPGLSKPPNRSLLKPPARPKPPTPAPAPPAAPAAAEPEAPPTPQRPGPISLPSEPMQYRAIGLLKGKYKPSEEQFNRGDIVAEDETLIDAVLLGRVTSLIKKHLDLEKDHLWVVYPRTLYKDKEDEEKNTEEKTEETATEENAEEKTEEKYLSSNDTEGKVPALHVQIVGVWEPETLNADTEYESEEERPLSSEEAHDQCDQFSIRGEIAKYSEEDGEITVNIVQKSKSENVKPKRPFKLLINGSLKGRTTGYFWDLKVERQAGKLTLVEGKSIAVVPPKKKHKGKKGGARRRPMGGSSKPRSAGAPKPKPKPKSADTAAAVSEASPVATAAEAAKETADA